MSLPIDIVFGWCRGDEEFEMNQYNGAKTDEFFGILNDGLDIVKEGYEFAEDILKKDPPKEGESGYKPPTEEKKPDFLSTKVKLPVVGDVKYWQIGAAIALMILLRK